MTPADNGRFVSYTPGQHLLLAAPSCWLMLGADAEKARGCWPLVRDGADADDLLDAILEAGLRSTGSFGLVRHTPQGLRVVVRGDIVVRYGQQVIAATAEQSWVDTMVAGDASVTMGADEEVGEGLPLVLGVVRAASVQIGDEIANVHEVIRAVPTVADAERLEDVTVEPADDELGQTPGLTDALVHETGTWQTGNWQDEPPAKPLLIDSMPFAINPPVEPSQPPEARLLETVESEVDDATIVRGSLAHHIRPMDPSNPLVLAVRCAGGHLNPGFVTNCRVCGSLLDAQTPIEVMRPILGQLRLSTGDVVALDRGVVLGRAPSPSGGSDETPHLIKLATHDTELSRSHVEVSLDGWHVVVNDLGSMNGTIVTRPGSLPERLRPHEAQIIEPGTTVTLADVVSFRFEATP